MDFTKPSYYTNRELSWLDFNSRVLGEALDESVPLLERTKFISIVSSNLDEFFMVRIAGLKEQMQAGFTRPDPSGLTPSQQLKSASVRIHEMVSSQYRCFNRALRPALHDKGITFTSYEKLTERQTEYINDYFDDIIFPVLTPMAIDAGRPFPFIANKTVNIAFKLQKENNEHYAIVRIPSVIPRIIKVPAGLNDESYLFIEDIITQNASRLFHGYKIISSTGFRVTRDADLSIDEDDAVDLLSEIEQQVRQRQWGLPVRLEIERGQDIKTRTFLASTLGLQQDDIYLIDGYIDLSCLMGFSEMPASFTDLRYPENSPAVSEEVSSQSMFELMKEKDYLVHHPYQSFKAVMKFLDEAADDPDVLAIKQALYRVSGNSPVVQALIRAAQNGKQVTVLVELKARFDEENNITWARMLEHAGCHVVYGKVGLKIHSKILLVIRREKSGIKRYIHMGTGNYNDKTARLYTDFGFFTSRESFAVDLSSLFNTLTGYTIIPEMKKLIVAPDGLRTFVEKAINNEIWNAKNGDPARIVAKMNSLSDPGIIKLLYEASCAGVEIHLIVRGICCLKPGIKNVSSNIKVKSIIGRYLEHSRIFCFENGGTTMIYMGSADMMTRNLDRRVEALFPIEDEKIKERIIDILDILWHETDKSRWLKSDGRYTRPVKTGSEAHIQLHDFSKTF
ncbi:MAG: RNA degradosome polyphosphate kinase [Clostridiales bacterium]|nr:RNA degradosome polyphosphate kinase [Clostridiales bacterium]